MTLKKKIAMFTVIFLVLISGAVILTERGMNQIQIVGKEAKTAHKIQASFQEVRLCFEQTLMGPHDYLIEGVKEEREIFRKDFKAPQQNLCRG